MVTKPLIPDAQLAQRYESGESQDNLGTELGLSGNGVRYRLQRFYGIAHYNRIVTKVLVFRVTRARGRALKHALAMLRQKRPALYMKHLERAKPKTCSDCARPIHAKLVAMWWRWNCAWCGASGYVPSLPSSD